MERQLSKSGLWRQIYGKLKDFDFAPSPALSTALTRATGGYVDLSEDWTHTGARIIFDRDGNNANIVCEMDAREFNQYKSIGGTTI